MTITKQPPPAEHQPIVKHRLTVVENIYHQVNGGNPTPIGGKPWSKDLLTDEEAYSTRRAIATTEPSQLDLGWLEGKLICMLVIKNEEDGKIPDIGKKLTLFVGDVEFAMIPAGESCRFCPVNPDQMKISSLTTDAKYTLYVIPG